MGKLLSTVAVASLGMALMMDPGAAHAKSGCAFGDRETLFGGDCRVERGYRGHRRDDNGRFESSDRDEAEDQGFSENFGPSGWDRYDDDDREDQSFGRAGWDRYDNDRSGRDQNFGPRGWDRYDNGERN